MQNRTKGAETRSSKPAMYRLEMTLKRNFQKLRESPGVRYESVGRGFESLPSHQEKPVHIVYWFFFFVCAMEGARTGRRRIAPQAISPVGCCLARGFQCVGMSTVEAVNRKISWLFCFSGRGRTHLHTFCTLYKKAMLSLHCSHSVHFAAQKRNFYAKSTRVSSRRSSASICRMASRIILPVIFVAAGILLSGDACGPAPAVSCR